MKVRVFGSFVKDYEETAESWFVENKDLNVKHISIALNQAGDWVLTAIFYSD